MKGALCKPRPSPASFVPSMIYCFSPRFRNGSPLPVTRFTLALETQLGCKRPRAPNACRLRICFFRRNFHGCISPSKFQQLSQTLLLTQLFSPWNLIYPSSFFMSLSLQVIGVLILLSLCLVRAHVMACSSMPYRRGKCKGL